MEYYFIFYHGNKYVFFERKLRCKCFGVRLKFNGVYYCLINTKYSKAKTRIVRHSLLTGRKLKYRKKRG